MRRMSILLALSLMATLVAVLPAWAHQHSHLSTDPQDDVDYYDWSRDEWSTTSGYEEVDLVRAAAELSDTHLTAWQELVDYSPGWVQHEFWINLQADGRSLQGTSGKGFVVVVPEALGRSDYIYLMKVNPDLSWTEVSCSGMTKREEQGRLTVSVPRPCMNNPDIVWMLYATWTSDCFHCEDPSTADEQSDVLPNEVNAAGASYVGPLKRPGYSPAPTYPTPQARDVKDTCDSHQQRRFDDTAGTAHEYMINCVAGYEITTGKTATTYDPKGLLTRGQTATFLARTLEAAGVELPGEGSDTCAETDVHATNVERLIAKNVIQAPSDRRCHTSQPISRDLMAHWTRQALAVGGVRTDENTNWYSDDDSSPYERHINEITTLGIVTGKGDATFGPTETLARGQMATFLARALDALRNARGL